MKETIFNDIYNQYEPDRQVVSRLIERVKKEKTKTVPFKPIFATVSAAAGLALCIGAVQLIPSGPDIEVANPAVLTTTTVCTTISSCSETKASYKSNIIIYDPDVTIETPPGATTAPCYGPPIGELTTDVTCAHEKNPEITCACIKTTTDITITSETLSSNPDNSTSALNPDNETSQTTATELVETEQSICSVPTATAVTSLAKTEEITENTTTTLPPETENKEDVEKEEEESVPEVAYEDKSDMIAMPMFDTFGEYCDYFKLWDKLDNVRLKCQIVSEDFTTHKNAEIDGAIAEEVLLYLKNCKFNYNAGYHYKNVRLCINDEIYISIQKSGTIQIHVDNYDGPAVFEGDPEVYNKLLKLGKSIDGGEVIPHITIDESNYSDDEVPPGQVIEPD